MFKSSKKVIIATFYTNLHPKFKGIKIAFYYSGILKYNSNGIIGLWIL
jgi:hypothetical protein